MGFLENPYLKSVTSMYELHDNGNFTPGRSVLKSTKLIYHAI
jgi:hypothetical protein